MGVIVFVFAQGASDKTPQTRHCTQCMHPKKRDEFSKTAWKNAGKAINNPKTKALCMKCNERGDPNLDKQRLEEERAQTVREANRTRINTCIMCKTTMRFARYARSHRMTKKSYS